MRAFYLETYTNPDGWVRTGQGVEFPSGLVVLNNGKGIRVYPNISTITNGVGETRVVCWEDQKKPTAPTAAVLQEVGAERGKQDRRWGKQDHADGVNPNYMKKAEDMKSLAEEQNLQGNLTWNTILQEEVFEALSCDAEDTLRAELIQVAAVAVAWVEAIDARLEEKRELEGDLPEQ